MPCWAGVAPLFDALSSPGSSQGHEILLDVRYKIICTCAQYVTLDNKIKCLSLAVFFLTTPPIKL
jgi:hypothetical protein